MRSLLDEDAVYTLGAHEGECADTRRVHQLQSIHAQSRAMGRKSKCMATGWATMGNLDCMSRLYVMLYAK